MGQELLSTFATSIGEIALIPATGGIFTVHLNYLDRSVSEQANLVPAEVLIWDRKRDGGFPEAKILKQLIRNHIDPQKSLGHSDTPSSKAQNPASTEQSAPEMAQKSLEENAEKEVIQAKPEVPCEECN